MLEVRDLVVRYGSATALDRVSLDVARGEMVALIGPNGAGKTTLLNTICGLLEPAGGAVSLGGRVAQVPEGRQLFAGMTVAERADLRALLRRLADTGAAILVVEHDMGFVRAAADRVSVLDAGRIVTSGRPEAVPAEL